MKIAETWQRPITVSLEVEAGDLDTSGYATISNTGSAGAFVGATVPAITTSVGTGYELDVTIDGTPYKLATITITDTDDWATIVASIQSALQTATSSTETVAIVDGKIKVSSVTDGATSTVLIAAGTAGTGDGDLLAVIEALTGYDIVLDTPVGGTEGTVKVMVGQKYEKGVLKDFKVSGLVVTNSSDIVKTDGLIVAYDKTTGYVSISDNGATAELASGDKVTFSGTFINFPE